MDPVQRLREICMALPEVDEKLSHGEPTWFARKVFVQLSDHHHDDRLGFWCAAPPGTQEALVAAEPERFFVPPYVGAKGWLGVRLDIDEVDWDEIAELVEESYRLIAPGNLIAYLDERSVSPEQRDGAYARVAKICLALPEAENKPFGGHHSPTFRVRDKIFCGTGQVGRPRIDFKAAPGGQDTLVTSSPERFFVPAYSGGKGWVGAWLDLEQDWDELAELIEDSYRLIAPKALVAQLDAT